MTITPPAFATDLAYGFDILRKQMSTIVGPGIVTPGDLTVSPQSGLQVQVSAGQGYVLQTVSTEGSAYAGLYYLINDATATPANTITAPSVNPRIDQVVLRVYDVTEQSLGGSSFAQCEWVRGTETSGANLTNLSGAAALPANSLLLANVLQTVGESSISSGNIANVVRLSSSKNSARRLLLSCSGGMAAGAFTNNGVYFFDATGLFAGTAGSFTGPSVWAGGASMSGNPPDFTAPGTSPFGLIRVSVLAGTTDAATSVQVGLYPVTSTGIAGGGGATVGVGTVVAQAPSLEITNVSGESAPFALPTDSQSYLLGAKMTGTGTLAHPSLVTAQLYCYNA